jgi:hypothetical protein
MLMGIFFLLGFLSPLFNIGMAICFWLAIINIFYEKKKFKRVNKA